MYYANDLSDSQKRLLDLYGHRPNMTEREMAKEVGFKYYNYVSTVKNSILEKKGYLVGPYYYLNFRKVGSNQISRLLIFIMFDKRHDYDYIIRLLKNIESWSFFYPLQESSFNEMLVGVYSTDHGKVAKIFNYLRDQNIIQFFLMYELEGNMIAHNPYFFARMGKKFVETPYECGKIGLDKEFVDQEFDDDGKAVRLSELDTRLIMYLQSGQKKAELSKLMKQDAKIVDADGKNPYVWGYNSWRYSFEKIIKNGIMEKFYVVYPLPKNLCSHFFLLLRGRDINVTKRLAANVGAISRTLRSGSMVRSLNENDRGELYWCAHVRSHPIFAQKISSALDMPCVETKFIYHVKSISQHDNDAYRIPYMNYYSEQSISLERRYYDHDKQLLEYDYKQYLHNIKSVVDRIP